VPAEGAVGASSGQWPARCMATVRAGHSTSVPPKCSEQPCCCAFCDTRLHHQQGEWVDRSVVICTDNSLTLLLRIHRPLDPKRVWVSGPGCANAPPTFHIQQSSSPFDLSRPACPKATSPPGHPCKLCMPDVHSTRHGRSKGKKMFMHASACYDFIFVLQHRLHTPG
jgi:hypothetical protein